jgi:bisphosphoglycerate-dependent phosphoglycerate mutase
MQKNATKCYFNLYLVRQLVFVLVLQIILIKKFYLLFCFLSGETEENRCGIIQGQTNTQLTQIGIEQARKLGQKLIDTKFTHVYSSDLDRAYQVYKNEVSLKYKFNCFFFVFQMKTAVEILTCNNFPTSDIIKDKLLRERV